MKIKNNRLVANNGTMVPWVASPNIGGNLSNGGRPDTLVMHYTAGGAGSGTVSYFKKPSAKVSAHLVIGRDGDITQMVKFDRTAWHAGKSRWKGKNAVNRFSIGIELANYGKLRHSGNGGWVSATGKSIPTERVVLDEHKHFPGSEYGWEVFDKQQIDVAVEVAQAIVMEFGLEPWDLVGHEDISPHRKIDPGPAFGMDRFRTLVFGREEETWNDNIFKVDSPTGLNLRIAGNVGATVIEKLPDGAPVHVIEKSGNWWLVAKVVNGNEDKTGYVHRNWLAPN